MNPVDMKAIRGRSYMVENDPATHDVEALLALAELQTRALLAVEWAQKTMVYEGRCCPICFGSLHEEEHEHLGHHEGCPIDAALTAAGLPDQASRDAAREKLK